MVIWKRVSCAGQRLMMTYLMHVAQKLNVADEEMMLRWYLATAAT
jgi:hypothetical protein